MDVTIYNVELGIGDEIKTQYFVSDGEGPDIEVGSASVAAIVARCCDARNGCELTAALAAMWLRHGAREREFFELEKGEELDGNHRIQAFVERNKRSVAPLFVGMDNQGFAKTRGRALRSDVEQELRTYLLTPSP